ncbi:hypothetical protein J7M28_00475 [bacterium]|nr:hypothetical protein [bacterium]
MDMFIFGSFKDPIAWAERLVGRKSTYETVVNSTIVLGTVIVLILVVVVFVWIGPGNPIPFYLLLVLCFHIAFYGIFWPIRYIKALRALVLERKGLMKALSHSDHAGGQGVVGE